MGGKPQNPRRYGNQDGSLYSLVPSVRRAIDWNNPQRVFGPVGVLDGNGFRDKTKRVQKLLQRVSKSCWAERRNSDRNARMQRRESQIISLAATLSSAVPNTGRGMSTNSPATGSSRLTKIVFLTSQYHQEDAERAWLMS